MAITAKMVADLRAQTGCGMMECKKALTAANGDFDEAVKVLREKGLAAAGKKADRIAADGLVVVFLLRSFREFPSYFLIMKRREKRDLRHFSRITRPIWRKNSF